MSRKLLVGSLVTAASALVLILGTSKPRAMYSFGVSDFMAHPRGDERVRVSGALVHGTLCNVGGRCEYRFSLSDRGQALAVSFEGCVVPDTFRDVPWLDVEVTVEGEYCQRCHAFKASSLMAKCPAKYEMKTNGYPYGPIKPIPRCKGPVSGRSPTTLTPIRVLAVD
jgi:cytochrome c-type biogenesis protein CcmE